MKLKTALILVATLLGLASIASAQTTPTFNPRTVTITPGADYNAQLADGTSLVTGVRLQYFLQGVDPLTGSPVTTVNLCKPALTAAGLIVVTTSTGTACANALLFATPLVTNTTYYATATEYGPGGESGRSPASNPFALSGAPAKPLAVAVSK
jgi:hypothetical protein